MRTRPLSFFAVVFAVTFGGFSHPALAKDCAGRLSTCINDDTFWPHAGPGHFVSIGATETIAPRQVAFGLVTSYLSRPILLRSPTPGPGGSLSYAINDQVNGSFLFALGVMENLQADAVLPMTFGQGGAGTSAISGGRAINDTAMRDARVGLTYALLPRNRVAPGTPQDDAQASRVYAVTARSEVSLPTGDATQFAGENGPVWIPTVVADYRRRGVYAAVEVGARVRAGAEIAGARIGTQGIVAAGVSYDLLKSRPEWLTLGLEARALPALAAGQSPAEWTGFVRTAPVLAGDMSVQLAGGGPLPLTDPAPITVPRVRFTVGFRYAPLGRDSDGDGVLDKDDVCPSKHGVAGNPAGHGCPETPAEAAPLDFVAPEQPSAPNPPTSESPSASPPSASTPATTPPTTPPTTGPGPAAVPSGSSSPPSESPGSSAPASDVPSKPAGGVKP